MCMTVFVCVRSADSSCEEAFKVAGVCALNGPLWSPRGKFYSGQMAACVIDLIEKYIRGSAEV